MTISVTNIQRFCMHDGPGIRTVVFLKGCPLRCKWCHNPETQSEKQQLLYYDKKCISCRSCEAVCKYGAHSFDGGHRIDRGKCTLCGGCVGVCPTGALENAYTAMTAEQIIDEIERDRSFYGKNGGATFSGGEPALHTDALLTLLEECRRRGISTAIETCGYYDGSFTEALVRSCDLFLWDFKDSDADRHRLNTGVSNERIVGNLLRADKLGAKTVLRCIMIKNINMNAEHYNGIIRLYRSLSGCEGVDLLPYHVYGESKLAALGGISGGGFGIPDGGDIAEARAYLENSGVKVRN